MQFIERHWGKLALGIALAATWFALKWIYCGDTPIKSEHLGALSSAAEVSIGICVAYLGFDRFRYHTRVLALAEDLAKSMTDRATFEKKAREDENLDSDERGVLFFYRLAGHELGDLPGANGQATREHDFARGLTGLLGKIALRGGFDRRCVQAALIILASYVFLAAIAGLRLTHPGLLGWTEWPMYYGLQLAKPTAISAPSVRLEWMGLFGILFGYAAPGLSFIINDSILRGCKRSAISWKKSITGKAQAAAQAAPDAVEKMKNAVTRQGVGSKTAAKAEPAKRPKASSKVPQETSSKGLSAKGGSKVSAPVVSRRRKPSE